MYVLSQFPTATRVRLPEFVQGAERAAHTVLQRLYSHEIAETKDFLEQLATPESLKALLRKPSAPLEGEKKAGNVVLEQLNVNSAVLSAVEYTSETVDEAVVREWLAFRVQYDVTEHLLVSPEGEQGIEDRRAVNTSFMWTFEADVTKPEEFEWAIVAATPFKEEAAVLKTKEAQDSDDSKETNE
ncbi:hypothetical protein PHYBOEH_007984 [Phytophthora boehmeriae]|uniref:Uncharacterized protein n=1 Tax=Phytophthora boehmeriae TaxID=109152 RepID=A0A8T1W7T7_9STRA|nr:hypothetical protein PHYBOEH_007984 [Phytophthora boehmeriae]